MIARLAIAQVPGPGRRLVAALADTFTLVARAARAVAENLGWSLWRRYQVRQTMRLLAQVPDHMLRDIGRTRMDLMGATVRRVLDEEATRRSPHW